MNDRDGHVRAAVGAIGDTFWTLPVGADADRVSTPQRPLPVPADAGRSVIHRTPSVVFVAYETAGGGIWSIEAPDGAR